MANYITTFETHSDYESTTILEYPNVSIINEDMSVIYIKEGPYNGFCKLTLTSGTEVEIEGSGELTETIITDKVGTNKSTITNVELGKQCTSIGDNAFEYCGNLISITIPDSVTSIGDTAFSECSSLTSLTIGNGLTSIGSSAFYECSSLTSITMPNSVTSIGESAFYECSGLISITIPDSVTSIGERTFGYCSSLTSVTIGNGLTSIGYGAFQECSELANINVNSGNTVYNSHNNCNAIIETETNKLVLGCKATIIPSGVTSIGDGAFDGCSGLISITIPNSVTSIGDYAFSSCNGLTSITIPNSVTSIGYGVFEFCSSLTSVTIGNGVTSIGSGAFSECSKLASIISNAMTAPTISSYTFEDIKKGGTLTVPSGSTGYNVWMGTGNYYLGKYNWTKVEQ